MTRNKTIVFFLLIGICSRSRSRGRRRSSSRSRHRSRRSMSRSRSPSRGRRPRSRSPPRRARSPASRASANDWGPPRQGLGADAPSQPSGGDVFDTYRRNRSYTYNNRETPRRREGVACYKCYKVSSIDYPATTINPLPTQINQQLTN